MGLARPPAGSELPSLMAISASAWREGTARAGDDGSAWETILLSKVCNPMARATTPTRPTLMSLSASVWGERPRDFVAGGVLGFLARLGLGCRFGLDFAITYHPPGRSPGNGLPYSLSNDTRVSTYQIAVAYWSNQPHLAQRQRISEPEAAPTAWLGCGRAAPLGRPRRIGDIPGRRICAGAPPELYSYRPLVC